MIERWIDPLAKWRPDHAGSDDTAAGAAVERGRSDLLAGQPESARHHFDQAVRMRGEARELVGLGDALMLMGEHEPAAESFRRATGSPMGACGLSQVLVAQENAAEAVRLLDDQLARHPDDAVVRHHLAGALLCMADQVRSLTRDEVLVITSRRQFDTCADIARQVTEVAMDPAHLAAARELRVLTSEGARWVWHREASVMAYMAVTVVLGFAAVVVGGAVASVAVVVAGALLGAAAVFGLVMGYRRQAWQVQADRVAPLVWRHGEA
jgi:tetratricopeptide (TPR) repeat protein